MPMNLETANSNVLVLHNVPKAFQANFEVGISTILPNNNFLN